MTLHILIPCKSFLHGKSRLSPGLKEQERLALLSSLLDRTLDLALGLAAATHCHLVTGDEKAQAQATRKGITAIGDNENGLNAALDKARHDVFQHFGTVPLLVLPIDLPHARISSLRAFVTMGADVAIAPDREGVGTNALYLHDTVSSFFPFRFGPGSFALHCQAAREKGLKLAICGNAALAFDLDTPSHLADMTQVSL